MRLITNHEETDMRCDDEARVRSRKRVAFMAALAMAIAGTTAGVAIAQGSSDYEQVIAGRADKIIATLGDVGDEARGRVREALLEFYRSTTAWHETNGARRKELKSQQDDTAKAELAKLEEDLGAVRARFVEGLSADLSSEQVAKVKDGLTYNVLHVTEKAYGEMIERLTDEQKQKIHEWLVEARDLAISEGSSEAKHGVFGKFKGRINNYLSQQGYDLKAEEKGWQARRTAAAAGNTTKESN